MQRTSRLAAVLAVGAGMAATAAPALAETTTASGTFAEGPAKYVSDRMVGDDEELLATRKVRFTGTYRGMGDAFERILIHPDGTADVQIAIRFEGRACGEPASLVFLIDATSDLVTSVTGRYLVLDGTDVRGSGTFDAVPDVGGPYQGTADC